MKATENRDRQRRIILIASGVAAVLIAAVVGLSLGDGASSNEPDPDLTAKETFVQARDDTMREVRSDAAEEGYREGRKSGAEQGRKSGKRAGQSDGATQVQLEATSAAEDAAANAQAELNAIATPPP